MGKVVLIFLVGLVGSAHSAGFENCNQVFYNKTPPVATNLSIAKSNYNLCFTGFAVNYSGITKTGLWSAELLTQESLTSAKGIKRENNFHEDKNIPIQHRSLLSDYRGSGYDRGHLAAAGNRFSAKDKNESFTLANMIPQSPYNNQEVWRKIEEANRTYVLNNNQPAYVITGSLFVGQKLKVIGNRVMVPTHVYKVVMFPKIGVVGAWVAVNDDSGRMDVVSVAELQRYTGLNFFPTLPDKRVLQYRYLLPVSGHAAKNMAQINIASDSQTSMVFQQFPDPAYKNTASQNGNQTYQNNRDQIKDISQSTTRESVETGISILKKILE